MYNKNIKRFGHSGELRDDADIPRLRGELERTLINQMRDEGYLPIHEMSIGWATKWLGNKYSFVLTIFAAYAGRRKAQEYDFWEHYKLVKVQ